MPSSEDRIARFEQLAQEHPDNGLFKFSLAQALEAAGRADDAIAHYEACAATRDDWMMPRILLGKLLLAQGRVGEAKPVLQNALQLAIAQDHEDPAAELQALVANL